MIVSPDCQIEDVTPEDAITDPRLKNSPFLYPAKLTTTYINAYGYRFGGLYNIIFNHQEEVDIPSLPGNNQMPYYLDTEWGPQWMIATQPKGSTSLSKIFWVDAHTGKWRIADYLGLGLVGPSSVQSIIKSKYQLFWDAYNILEPRPQVRTVDNKQVLYWMTTIAAQGSSRISFTTLVNVTNREEVVSFCTKASLNAWLANKGEPDNLSKCSE